MSPKHIYSFLTFFYIGCSCLFSQTVNEKGTSTYTKCYKFYISKPLSEFPDAKFVKGSDKKEAADKLADKYRESLHKPKPGSFLVDPIVQSTTGTQALDTPQVNFEGLFGTLYPPDPSGAVSYNYYMQATNCLVTVYDKNGNRVMPIKDLGYLWDSTDIGDPVILYDKFADRWFISQIESYMNWPVYDLAVAVSTTNNPMGSYYVYKFDFGNTLPDYPKYSIWPDGYYCTCQFFYAPEKIVVLERNRMLRGDPTAGMITNVLPASHPFGGNNVLPLSPKTLDCDGALPPYGTPNYLFFFENTNSGGYSNSIIIYQLSTDTTLKTVTPTVFDSIPVAPFNAYFTGGRYDISQPGYAHSLDALDGAFNYRVPYIRFIGYNSVVLCNTVNLGGLVAGIRWYELHQNDTTHKFTIYQQGTYGPNDGVSRWNGSIGMNDGGDISLAYSVTDAVSLYPGIRYTGRLFGDPLGQMTFAEQTAIYGGHSMTTYPRYGDYSQTTLDPADGITFWHTNEYIDSNMSEETRIFSFKFDQPNGVQSSPRVRADLKIYQSGSMLNVIAASLPNDENTVINLFDINGKQLTSEWVKPQSGKIEDKINVSDFASGVYLVRIGNAKFQVVKKVVIN